MYKLLIHATLTQLALGRPQSREEAITASARSKSVVGYLQSTGQYAADNRINLCKEKTVDYKANCTGLDENYCRQGGTGDDICCDGDNQECDGCCEACVSDPDSCAWANYVGVTVCPTRGTLCEECTGGGTCNDESCCAGSGGTWNSRNLTTVQEAIACGDENTETGDEPEGINCATGGVTTIDHGEEACINSSQFYEAMTSGIFDMDTKDSNPDYWGAFIETFTIMIRPQVIGAEGEYTLPPAVLFQDVCFQAMLEPHNEAIIIVDGGEKTELLIVNPNNTATANIDIQGSGSVAILGGQSASNITFNTTGRTELDNIDNTGAVYFGASQDVTVSEISNSGDVLFDGTASTVFSVTNRGSVRFIGGSAAVYDVANIGLDTTVTFTDAEVTFERVDNYGSVAFVSTTASLSLVNNREGATVEAQSSTATLTNVKNEGTVLVTGASGVYNLTNCINTGVINLTAGTVSYRAACPGNTDGVINVFPGVTFTGEVETGCKGTVNLIDEFGQIATEQQVDEVPAGTIAAPADIPDVAAGSPSPGPSSGPSPSPSPSPESSASVVARSGLILALLGLFNY